MGYSHPPGGVNPSLGPRGNMTPLQQIQRTKEERETVTSQIGYMGGGLNMPYEEREAEDARGDSGRDLNVRELPEPIESQRQPSSVPPTSRQSWEERPTKRIGANEWDVNSTPMSLPVLDMDQTIPITLHTSSAHEEGDAPLCQVCQAPSCREHTTGDNNVCPHMANITTRETMRTSS